MVPLAVKSLLAVIGARAVLAQEMLVEQRLGNGIRCGIDLKGFHGHLGDDFEGECVFDRLGSGGSPGKGSVSMHQDGADLFGIEVVESFNDDIAGFPFVSAPDFFGGHRPRDRHLAVKVVGMRRAEAGDRLSGLGKGDRIA